MPKFIVREYITPKSYFTLELEISKKLTIWSLAKEIQDNPQLKRLAFKVLKKDKSTAQIFDEGIYVPEVEITKGVRKQIKEGREGDKVMKEGLGKGEIKFTLNGKKVKGSYALIKTKNFPPGKKNAWLLIKHR